jgi:hypothetical protein
MGLADLKRITDLFVEGTELVLKDDPSDPVLLWINKLNSFEVEEARRDGGAGRSRLMLALQEESSPDRILFDGEVKTFDEAKLREALLNVTANDRFVAAVEQVRNDADWAERLDIIHRVEPAEEISDEEKEILNKINKQYLDEVQARMDLKRQQEEADLRGLDLVSLRDKFTESWREQRGMNAFTREYNKSQLFFATRVCSAKTRTAVGGWDHSGCDHRQRAMNSRNEVAQLPDGLLQQLVTTHESVQIGRNDARFSAALASSSESSAQPNVEVESTPSTPQETSPEPATT